MDLETHRQPFPDRRAPSPSSAATIFGLIQLSEYRKQRRGAVAAELMPRLS